MVAAVGVGDVDAPGHGDDASMSARGPDLSHARARMKNAAGPWKPKRKLTSRLLPCSRGGPPSPQSRDCSLWRTRAGENSPTFLLLGRHTSTRNSTVPMNGALMCFLMTWRTRFLFATSCVVTAASVAVGCSVGLSGAGTANNSDASAVADVTPLDVFDASMEDATVVSDAYEDAVDSAAVGEDVACLGLRCNGQCVDAADCTSCVGAPLQCIPGGVCASDCSGCSDLQNTPMPIECFSCDVNHENPIGTCRYDDPSQFCLSGDYVGTYSGGSTGYRCGCADGGVCPGATQVCAPLGQSMFCLTCGEVTTANLQGQACQGGGTCQTSTDTCQ